MVYVAIGLLAVLVLLVFIMNPMGQGASQATAITENTWSLQSFSNADGSKTMVLNGTSITAKFSLDGTLTGSGGCNPYAARYMTHETGIVVSRVSAMPPACTDKNAMLQELQYAQAIENAAFLRVNNRVLTFYGTDGKPLLIFSPARVG
jgi:heat shock protein HslJ